MFASLNPKRFTGDKEGVVKGGEIRGVRGGEKGVEEKLGPPKKSQAYRSCCPF